MKWSRPVGQYLNVITSASGQNTPPVAPEIIGPKIKNARENNRERSKPNTAQINIVSGLSNFYSGLTFDKTMVPLRHGNYLKKEMIGCIISHNWGDVNPFWG